MTDVNDLDLEMPEDTPTSEENWTSPTDDGSTGSSPVDPVTEELKITKEALARAQADYRNLLTRTERDRVEMSAFLTERIILRVLPSLDALERIVALTPENEREGAVFKGVVQSASGLAKALDGLGLASFSSIGEKLDPALHEALMQAPGEEGIILQEIEKGYKISDRVIRHAKVVVGNGESAL